MFSFLGKFATLFSYHLEPIYENHYKGLVDGDTDDESPIPNLELLKSYISVCRHFHALTTHWSQLQSWRVQKVSK